MKSQRGDENMRDVYIFEYLNESEFKKRERSVKKYNMFAYKKLIFDFYPEMKNGNFIGKQVSEDKDREKDQLYPEETEEGHLLQVPDSCREGHEGSSGFQDYPRCDQGWQGRQQHEGEAEQEEADA